LTINVQDQAENKNKLIFTFQTKADLTAPSLNYLSPAKNQTGVLPDTSINFEIFDNEAGLDYSSLVLFVNNQLIAAEQLVITGNEYSADISYQPAELFELLAVIPVTININDLTGNTLNYTYHFTITNDFTKPIINIINPIKNSINNDPQATINLVIFDAESGINTGSIQLIRNNYLIAADKLQLEVSGNSCNVIYKPAFGEYGKTLKVTINAGDNIGNIQTTTFSYSTIADTAKPSITPISPIALQKDVDIFTPIVLLLSDTQTGISPLHTIMRINGQNVSALLEFNSTTYNTYITYRPQRNLDYLATINMEVIGYDNAGNQQALYYFFNTADDIYPPAPPTLNALPINTTSNISSFNITGETEYGTNLYIYANNILIASSHVENEDPVSTFSIPVNIDITGNVSISAVAVDTKLNTSNVSNILNLFLVNKEYSFVLDTTSVNVFIPLGAIDLEADLLISTLNITQTEYDNATLYFALDFSFVPTGNDTGKEVPRNFHKPIIITMDLPASINAPETAEIYYYDPINNTWKNDGITIIAKSSTQITFSTTHFTIFGLVTIKSINAIDNFNLIIAPNPVKLKEEAVHFVYRIDNGGSAEVRIYSISGELLTKFEKELLSGTA
jgi:hypothetical protein